MKLPISRPFDEAVSSLAVSCSLISEQELQRHNRCESVVRKQC